MQLEVRSLNVTWRRDLCSHRVIVFLGVSQSVGFGKFGGASYAPPFFAICEKPEGGG